MQPENDSVVCVAEALPLPPLDPEELADQHKRHWTPWGLAQRLIILFPLFRYIVETGLWLVWASGRWQQDTGGIRMHRLCKATINYTLENPDCGLDLLADYKKWLKRCETEPMIQQVLALSRSDRKLTISVNELDQHPHLLCCSDCIVDLRTGERLPNRPELYLIKNTNVPYMPGAVFPAWDEFLDEATGRRRAVRDFLQLYFGYSMQASTREERLLILLGKGATGKSTLAEGVSGAMGSYHRTASFSTFLKKERSGGGPSEDIARLRGARLVTASEVDDGQRFAEGTLKNLTGGDTITARELYQNSIEFSPEFKLLFILNHLPYMATDDTAIWRRIVIVDFNYRPEVLKTSLKAMFATPEAKTAILNWAVKGAIRWHQTGLLIPQEIEIVTAEAREEMDPVAAFIKEECLQGPRCYEGVTRLRQKYDTWAAENGQRYTLDRRRLNRALEAKGFKQGTRKLENGPKTR